MKFFREKYNHRNVTPKKVADSYEGCEQLLLQVGQGCLLEAAMGFWGMNDLQDRPTKHVPPTNIENQEDKIKSEYFHEVVGEFVDEYVLPNAEQQTSSSESDKVRWVTCLINNSCNTFNILQIGVI